ncbi:DnaD domain protein [Virgibacillus sp. 6R]|uniref:DnaD domain-containing protein n=1 Tax=Metabacillus sp. 22489 TaxID=3453928 RepID=UPI002102475B
MGKYRMIHTDFWDDPIVIEEMTPEERYFYLYLLTNTKTTQIGIYRITKKQIAFDLGYSIDTVQMLMERFIHQHKLIRYNSETRELAIRNWGKENLHKGGKPVMDCIASELKAVKDISLIQYVAELIPKQEIRSLFESFCATENSLSNEDSNQTEENVPLENDLNEAKEDSLHPFTIRGQKEKEKQKENKKEKQQQKQKAFTPYIENDQNRKNTPKVEDLVQNQQSSDAQEIIEFWDNNGFGYSNLNAKEQLLLWLDNSSFLQPKEMILRALEISCAMNKRRLNYVVGILRNWENESILTVNEIEDYNRQLSERKKRSKTKAVSGGRYVPSGFTLDITAGEDE